MADYQKILALLLEGRSYREVVVIAGCSHRAVAPNVNNAGPQPVKYSRYWPVGAENGVTQLELSVGTPG